MARYLVDVAFCRLRYILRLCPVSGEFESTAKAYAVWEINCMIYELTVGD